MCVRACRAPSVRTHTRGARSAGASGNGAVGGAGGRRSPGLPLATNGPRARRRNRRRRGAAGLATARRRPAAASAHVHVHAGALARATRPCTAPGGARWPACTSVRLLQAPQRKVPGAALPAAHSAHGMRACGVIADSKSAAETYICIRLRI